MQLASKSAIKNLKKSWYQNKLLCFEFLLCEKHCPESHKVQQLPLVEAEHHLVVGGESRSWDCKSQRAKSHRRSSAFCSSCSELQTTVSPLSLRAILMKSTLVLTAPLVGRWAGSLCAGSCGSGSRRGFCASLESPCLWWMSCLVQ